MPVLLIRHKVIDYAVWKPAFDAHGPTRGANGSLGGRVFRNVADPHDVLVLLAWDDLARARLFARSYDLQEAMARSGVLEEPELWFLEETDQPPV